MASPTHPEVVGIMATVLAFGALHLGISGDSYGVTVSVTVSVTLERPTGNMATENRHM